MMAEDKNSSKKVTRKGIRSQLDDLNRNIKTIEKQLDCLVGDFSLSYWLPITYWIIKTLSDQLQKMFNPNSRTLKKYVHALAFGCSMKTSASNGDFFTPEFWQY